MRHGLTVLATLLVVALLALIIAPRFIDWTARKDQVSSLLSETLGVEIRIKGALSLSLLPAPEFDAEMIEIGPVDAPVLRASRLVVAAAPMQLLSGTIRLSEARIDRAIVALAGLEGLFSQASPEGMQPSSKRMQAPSKRMMGVERFDFRDASVLMGNSIPISLPETMLSGLDGMIEAPNLSGPFRVEVSDSKAARDLRVQIGRFEDGQARLRGVIEDKGVLARMTLDGWFSTSAGRPLFDGAAQFSGNPLLPHSNAQIAFDGTARVIVERHQVVADPINLSLGAGEKALQWAGKGFADLTRPRPLVSLSLGAKRIDASAIMANTETPDWIGLRQIAERAAALSIPIDLGLDLTIGALHDRGALAENAALRLTFEERISKLHALRLRLPGQTDLAYTRQAGESDAFLDGTLSLLSEEPRAFLAFLRGSEPPGNMASKARLSAEIRSGPGHLRFDHLSMGDESGSLRGQARLSFPAPDQSPLPHLDIGLKAERFSAQSLAAFDPLRPLRGLDLTSRLDVRELSVEGRVAGGLTVELDRSGDQLTLKSLRLSGKQGEEFLLSGMASGETIALSAKLDAERVQDLAALASALYPGPLSAAILIRAPLLSPALAVGKVRIEQQAGDAVWDIAVEGKLAGSNVKASTRSLLRENALDFSGNAELNNPNGAQLLAQIFGVPVSGSAGGPGMLNVQAEGNPRRAIRVVLNGNAAGADLRFEGEVNPFRPQNPLSGQMRLESADLVRLMQALGRPLPGLRPGLGLRASAQLSLDRAKITLTRLTASLGEAPVSGEMSLDLARGGQVAGALKMPVLNLMPLFTPVLGAQEGLIESQPFAAAYAPALSGDLWLEAEKASFGPDIALDDAQFVLRFEPNLLAFDHFVARLGAAKLGGSLTMQRRGPLLQMGGRAIMEKFPLGASGIVLQTDLSFSTQGETPLALLAGLNGAGQARLDGINLPGADPKALSRLLAQPLDALVPLEENAIGAKLERELALAPLILPSLQAPITISNGQIRLSPAPVLQDNLDIAPDATFDLARRMLEARLRVRSEAPKGWRGAKPEIALNWRGLTSAPMRRQLSVSPLVNGLLAIAIERDLAKTEAYDADIRERAAFSRRLKAMEAARRRADTLETLRLKQEAERLQPAPQPEARPLDIRPTP